ncbi:hypothetical protein RB653_002817 [Dictyostelium firmibasis]|uniref:Uncharacterized protein n=1 Tax=Dictyostelium firmibasis TaxID=79012 RepID=A0AAN7TR54_9MYCE
MLFKSLISFSNKNSQSLSSSVQSINLNTLESTTNCIAMKSSTAFFTRPNFFTKFGLVKKALELLFVISFLNSLKLLFVWIDIMDTLDSMFLFDKEINDSKK